jgi:hypothetical protein
MSMILVIMLSDDETGSRVILTISMG